MPLLTLTAYEALAIERRLRDLARSGAFDLDDAAEPLRWALEHLSAETAILDVRRAPRQDRQPSQEVVK